jgi:geranylgeranyl reductase family protein
VGALTYDVAVVGGGPAGATVARLLAARGALVVLLEAERLPRPKPCGGGLTARAVRLLPQEVRELVRVRAPGARVRWGPWEVEVRSPTPGVWLVLRPAFDAALVDLARQAGAEVREGARVTAARRVADGVELQAAGATVRAHRLVCADGATGPFAGPLGRAVGLGPAAPRVGALEAEVDDPDGAGGVWLRGDFDVVRGGYAWVFPKAGVLSVGVASWARGAGGRVLHEALRRYLVRIGIEPARVVRLRGHPIPVGGRCPAAALWSPVAVRVGDAAGLADPLFGEGISHALESAHFAAEALLADDLAGYARRVVREIYPGFRVAALAARVFYARPGPWFAVLGRMPRAADAAYTLAVGGSAGALAP